MSAAVNKLVEFNASHPNLSELNLVLTVHMSAVYIADSAMSGSNYRMRGLSMRI